MEDLDILKTDWHKTQNYPDISEGEIYGFLHKKSSSSLKWILIISILELSIGAILSILMSFTKFDEKSNLFLKQNNIFAYYEVFMIFIYAVAIYFVFRFYKMYKKVSTTDNTKLLMQNILRTRKTVQNYILFNLITGALFLLVIFSFTFKNEIQKIAVSRGEQISDINNRVYLISFLVVLLITIIFTVLSWLFYKLLYGFLLKRLKRNYEELKKIDL